MRVMIEDNRRIGRPMCRSANFAVVLRQAQWELDRVAFRLPRGEVTRAERHGLADVLSELAERLREHE